MFSEVFDLKPTRHLATGGFIGVSSIYLNPAHSTLFGRPRKPWLRAFEACFRVSGIPNRWLGIPETGIIARNIKITRNDAGQTQFASIGSCRDFRRVLQPSAPSAEDLYKRSAVPAIHWRSVALTPRSNATVASYRVAE